MFQNPFWTKNKNDSRKLVKLHKPHNLVPKITTFISMTILKWNKCCDDACDYRVGWITNQVPTINSKFWKKFSVPLESLMLTNTYTVVLMQRSALTAALPTRLQADAAVALLFWAQPHDWLNCFGFFLKMGRQQWEAKKWGGNGGVKRRSSTSLYSSRR